ncbi:MAG: hypothetical protein QM528_05345 [Phycisphaerales bacterium]|nr:hypothetical protein [Phycisphaerales bacterium]
MKTKSLNLGYTLNRSDVKAINGGAGDPNNCTSGTLGLQVSVTISNPKPVCYYSATLPWDGSTTVTEPLLLSALQSAFPTQGIVSYSNLSCYGCNMPAVFQTACA